jgi:hypothetical protein
VINTAHYCETHNTKFYKNEKPDPSGLISVWYSHKKADGSGFCVEKTTGSKGGSAIQTRLFDGAAYNSAPTLSNQAKGMYACNAMNNAVALASNGVIGVDQIGQYFQKIYSELSKLDTAY